MLWVEKGCSLKFCSKPVSRKRRLWALISLRDHLRGCRRRVISSYGLWQGASAEICNSWHWGREKRAWGELSSCKGTEVPLVHLALGHAFMKQMQANAFMQTWSVRVLLVAVLCVLRCPGAHTRLPIAAYCMSSSESGLLTWFWKRRLFGLPSLCAVRSYILLF